MKVLTREQALQRLDNPNNLFNLLYKKDYANYGKSENRHKTGEIAKFSPEMREAAVNLSVAIGTNGASEIVGAGPRTISDWKRGVTSHSGSNHNTEANRPKEEVIKSTQEKISEKVAERVLTSLDMMIDDKLSACNAVELATVAARLSSITGKDKDKGTRINVNIHVPQKQSESSFKTIEATAQVA